MRRLNLAIPIGFRSRPNALVTGLFPTHPVPNNPCGTVRVMDAAGDLAERRVRVALGFHRTGNAVGLPGSKDDGVGCGDVRTLLLEGSPFAT